MITCDVSLVVIPGQGIVGFSLRGALAGRGSGLN